MPERDEEPAGKRNDHDPPKPTVCAGLPFVEPLGQAAMQLMLRAPPRDLQHEIGKCRSRSLRCPDPWNYFIDYDVSASPLKAANPRQLLNLRQNVSGTSNEASFGPTLLMQVTLSQSPNAAAGLSRCD